MYKYIKAIAVIWLACLTTIFYLPGCSCYICVSQNLWELFMSLQSFDATTLTGGKKERKRIKQCKCVHIPPSLNMYILMWVTVSCGLENNTEVFPGSQMLYYSSWWVIILSTRKCSISLPVLPLCLWEWGEALSHVLETHCLKHRTEDYINITICNLCTLMEVEFLSLLLLHKHVNSPAHRETFSLKR